MKNIKRFYQNKNPIIKKDIEKTTFGMGNKEKIKLLITKWNIGPAELSNYLSLPFMTKNSAKILMKYGAFPDAQATKEALSGHNTELLDFYLKNGGSLEDMDEETWENLFTDENWEKIETIAESRSYSIDMMNLSIDYLDDMKDTLESKLDDVKKLIKMKKTPPKNIELEGFTF